MLVPKLKQITVANIAAPQPIIAANVSIVGKIVGVSIQAHTGVIWVGDSTVSNTAGIKLTTTSGPYTLPLSTDGVDLHTVYVTGGTNNDIADIIYFEKVSR